MFSRLHYFIHVYSCGMLLKFVLRGDVVCLNRTSCDLSDHSWHIQSLIAQNHPQQSPVMASLEQLVQDWLDLDKVRIHFVDRDAIILYDMGSRKRQGPRSRDCGDREIIRSLRVDSGIFSTRSPVYHRG